MLQLYLHAGRVSHGRAAGSGLILNLVIPLGTNPQSGSNIPVVALVALVGSSMSDMIASCDPLWLHK